ncbi:TITAN-like protein isoform X2 [Lactuca sativa]|uniref:TITAN-like protein isoform X2 n=1 Tax=Lactuca sativa TaxID=4236 RepID=UPI001C690E45|nr:TITAN-like protein isoform X2 [Lactuca sativa]
MKEPSETKHPNTTERNSKTKGKNNNFEFCKVCKLNHNLGRRHNYLPNHVKSLSTFLSRFQSKLSDVRLFLKNPNLLRPELASRNRFWCVFCDSDVAENDSSFACILVTLDGLDHLHEQSCRTLADFWIENAISHLASADHLKNLKSFMWKHGGGMDRIDGFRISEADIAKYEKKCISMKKECANEQSHGPMIGPSNDIHNELKFDYVDNFDRHNSSFLNGVSPLQYHTNEKYQVSHSDMSGGYDDKLLLLGSNAKRSSNLKGNAGKSCLNEGYPDNKPICQVYAHNREANGDDSSLGLQKLTRISSTVHETDTGNVHSGAPPPWFNAKNGIHVDPGMETDPVIKPVKSKLNPKRVGAAWAEKRKIEMEMERNGELPAKRFDGSWLPNFGRVWQSGSRKDSRKEFQVETKKPLKDEKNHSDDSSLQLQPYISKRMRREANE